MSSMTYTNPPKPALQTHEKCSFQDYEEKCEFIRQQFQEIIARKDRLIEKQMTEISSLKQHLSSTKKIVYLKPQTTAPRTTNTQSHPHLHRMQKSDPLNTLSPPSEPLQVPSNAELSLKHQVDDIQQFTSTITDTIQCLEKRLEDSDSIISRLNNTVSTQKIKMKRKHEEITSLKWQCEQYRSRFIKLVEATDIFKKAVDVKVSRKQLKHKNKNAMYDLDHSDHFNHLVLDKGQKVTIKELLETIQNVVHDTKERDIIGSVHCHLHNQYDTLMDLQRKYNTNPITAMQTFQSARTNNKYITKAVAKELPSKLVPFRKRCEAASERFPNLRQQVEKRAVKRVALKHDRQSHVALQPLLQGQVPREIAHHCAETVRMRSNRLKNKQNKKSNDTAASATSAPSRRQIAIPKVFTDRYDQKEPTTESGEKSEKISQIPLGEASIVQRIRNTLKESERIHTSKLETASDITKSIVSEKDESDHEEEEKVVSLEEKAIGSDISESKSLLTEDVNVMVMAHSDANGRNSGYHEWRPPTLDVSDEVGEFWPPPKDTAEHLEEMMKREELPMVSQKQVPRENQAIPVQKKNTPISDESSTSFSTFIKRMLNEVGRSGADSSSA